ncbi:MAG TPA: exodeoxyribonuclease III [Acidobacteria bacterium]|nr:exodeoxyribonuclease III [Acidobacteriota bacterium]
MGSRVRPDTRRLAGSSKRRMSRERMKIATWNINGLRARIEFVLHWLRTREPDIVGLQELKLTDEEFPVDEFRAAGYHAEWFGQKSWNGVAILSREPATLVRRGLPGEEGLGSRLITARVGDLSFTTVYCPNGKSTDHDDFPRKLAWFESLHRLLEAEHDPGQPTVLCGDFNVVPAPIDSWDEAALAGQLNRCRQDRSAQADLLAFAQSHARGPPPQGNAMASQMWAQVAAHESRCLEFL